MTTTCLNGTGKWNFLYTQEHGRRNSFMREDLPILDEQHLSLISKILYNGAMELKYRYTNCKSNSVKTNHNRRLSS